MLSSGVVNVSVDVVNQRQVCWDLVGPERMTTFESIGYWSELKLEIIRKYAAAYSRILAAQRGLSHLYVDAFAGPGYHVSRTTGEMVPDSPLNALLIEPRFREYHLIDLDTAKAAHLRALVRERPEVFVYEGDANEVLLQQIFPRLRMKTTAGVSCSLIRTD